MSANINIVIISGNLTRDPELKYLPSGQAVGTFSIAVNRSYSTDSGEKKESVSFFRVVAWAKLGEICNEFLKKGSAVMVDGRLESRSWETDGVKKTTIEVIAAHVHFLSPKNSAPTEVKKSTSKKSSEFTDEELKPDDNFVPQ